jgi:hypothetical protein
LAAERTSTLAPGVISISRTRLGSVNAAAAELGATWPSLRKAFARHGLGMPARNPEAVRQRAMAAASRRAGQPATPGLDPVFVALNPGALPARPRSQVELYQWVRREEQYATLGAQRSGRAVQREPRPSANHPNHGRSFGGPTAATGWPANAPAGPTAVTPIAAAEPTGPAAPSNPGAGEGGRCSLALVTRLPTRARVLTSAATDAASYSEGGWPRSGWHTEHVSIDVATAGNRLPFE